MCRCGFVRLYTILVAASEMASQGSVRLFFSTSFDCIRSVFGSAKYAVCLLLKLGINVMLHVLFLLISLNHVLSITWMTSVHRFEKAYANRYATWLYSYAWWEYHWLLTVYYWFLSHRVIWSSKITEDWVTMRGVGTVRETIWGDTVSLSFLEIYL